MPGMTTLPFTSETPIGGSAQDLLCEERQLRRRLSFLRSLLKKALAEPLSRPNAQRTALLIHDADAIVERLNVIQARRQEIPSDVTEGHE